MTKPLLFRGAMIALFATVAAGSAFASESWPSIQNELYAGRTIHDGTSMIKLTAPDRPKDQMEVPVSVEATLRDGRSIKTITLIVDENPTPIAAKFRFGQTRTHVGLATNFRFDAVTGVRAILETNDGELYMAERHVRFTGGQSACAAPPNGTPEEIAAKMGKMKLAELTPSATRTNERQRVRLQIGHPNHTGMVKDQITLYYIPLLLLHEISIRQGDDTMVDIEGSMSLSQDPTFEFDFLTNGAQELTVTAGDTSGATWKRSFPLGPSS